MTKKKYQEFLTEYIKQMTDLHKRNEVLFRICLDDDTHSPCSHRRNAADELLKVPEFTKYTYIKRKRVNHEERN